MIAILTGVRWYLIVVLLALPYAKRCWASSHLLVGHLHFLSGKSVNTTFICTVVVVQLPSHVRLFATPWTAAHQASLSFTISWSLLKLMTNESVTPYNHLILCHPLLILPSILPSIRVFSNESALHTRWQKYWSFSFSPSLSNEYLVLISFRIDWLDLLAVQGTLKSLLQHHSSKTSILRHSAFFICTRKHKNSGEWLYSDICFVLIA